MVNIYQVVNVVNIYQVVNLVNIYQAVNVVYIYQVVNSSVATEGTLSYVAQDYAKQVLGILNEFRKTKMFCDVFLSVNGAVSLS